MLRVQGVHRLAGLLALLVLPAVPSPAQPIGEPAPDTLHLNTARSEAVRQDPRVILPALLARATEQRLGALRAQRLPQLALRGQATVQSDVAGLPMDLPGQAFPAPPHAQFLAELEVDWVVIDGGRAARQALVERARLAEGIAGVDVELYALQEAAGEAYFGALLYRAQAEVLALAEVDLEAHLDVVRSRASAGAALPADVASLEAELIRVRQCIDEAVAGRRAALAVLGDLTGHPGLDGTALTLPGLDAEVAHILASLDEASVARPELLRLAHASSRAEAEAEAREAHTRPTLSLFGRVGAARPSPFDPFSDDMSEFGVAGLRLRWELFDGGRTRREAEALRLQARIAETEASAFARHALRSVAEDRAALLRLDDALDADERAIVLREEEVRTARRQLDEGVILADVYTDRLTDLADARMSRERHRIERARAQARLLTRLGRYPDDPTGPSHHD